MGVAVIRDFSTGYHSRNGGGDVIRTDGDLPIIDAEAGGTTLEFVDAPTLSQITTTLGGVNLRLPGTTAYDVDVETDVGASSVDVDRDPASAHKIIVHTEVGGVKIERLT